MLDQSTDIIRPVLDAGGPVVLVLLVLSVFALAVVLLKVWQFAGVRMARNMRLENAIDTWRAGQSQEAITQLEQMPRNLSGLVLAAMRGLSANIDAAAVREEVTRLASVHMESLREHLRTLEVIAAVSPLLGLFGTVLGMIEAFQQLESAGSNVDPALLSGGIWQALLTTAVGLGVAIPTVLAHNWLERRLEAYGHRINDLVTRVFTREVSRMTGVA